MIKGIYTDKSEIVFVVIFFIVILEFLFNISFYIIPGCWLSDSKAIEIARKFCEQSDLECRGTPIVEKDRAPRTAKKVRKVVSFETDKIGVDCSNKCIAQYDILNSQEALNDASMQSPLTKSIRAGDIEAFNDALGLFSMTANKLNIEGCAEINHFEIYKKDGLGYFIDIYEESDIRTHADLAFSGTERKLVYYMLFDNVYCSPDSKKAIKRNRIALVDIYSKSWEALGDIISNNKFKLATNDFQFKETFIEQYSSKVFDRNYPPYYYWKTIFQIRSDSNKAMNSDIDTIFVYISAKGGDYIGVEFIDKKGLFIDVNNY